MTDQEKLSVPLTPADASRKTPINNAPVIREVINQKGESIPNGGMSKDGNLTISGSFNYGDGEMQIWDAGISVAQAYFDLNGNFSAELPEQQSGLHEYTAVTEFGQVSSPWSVTVEVETQPAIESVYDPDGSIIADGQSTFHNELNFIGHGAPGRVVELVNNGTVLRLLNIDEVGHWSANVKGLPTGTQRFSAREPNGQESASWQVLIRKPTALKIKFILGQEQFQEIDNHGITTDKSVTITGTGNPHETGWIVDYHNDLVPFVVGESGVYSATIMELAENHVHTFMCKSDSGRLSAPWAVRVVSSKM